MKVLTKFNAWLLLTKCYINWKLFKASASVGAFFIALVKTLWYNTLCITIYRKGTDKNVFVFDRPAGDNFGPA